MRQVGGFSAVSITPERGRVEGYALFDLSERSISLFSDIEAMAQNYFDYLKSMGDSDVEIIFPKDSLEIKYDENRRRAILEPMDVADVLDFRVNIADMVYGIN